MKIVHAADLHLDSPLRGLERREGWSEEQVERLRGATRRALVNLVDLCLAEEVSLLLLAGDLYDGDWKDYSTGLFFVGQMVRLREAGIPVVWIRGNHDAASKITKDLRLPETVTELSHRRPETRVLDELGVAVHGQGFARAAVTEDLAAGYPEALPDLLNIGLLHTGLTGREGHDNYAPTTLETLSSKGYDYWALGHIHQREVVHEEPWVVFPGNLQGRHARETGPKGATLITVEEGRIIAVEPRVLDAVRWAAVTVDLASPEIEAETAEEALDAVRDALEEAAREASEDQSRPLVARLELVGESAAHAALEEEWESRRQQIRAVALDLSAVGEVWIEKIRLRTRSPLDLEEIAERDDAVGQVVRSLRRLQQDEEATELAELASLSDFKSLAAKLPLPARRAAADTDAVLPDDPAYLRSLLPEVEQILLPRLVSGKSAGGKGE